MLASGAKLGVRTRQRIRIGRVGRTNVIKEDLSHPGWSLGGESFLPLMAEGHVEGFADLEDLLHVAEYEAHLFLIEDLGLIFLVGQITLYWVQKYLLMWHHDWSFSRD